MAVRAYPTRAYLIDTTVYSHARRGSQWAADLLEEADHLGISTVSLGELLAGFKVGSKTEKNRKILYEFLDGPRVQIYPVSERTAEFYGEIYMNLRKQGTPIPTNDMWIAATAQEHGLVLASHDRHFEAVSGLICRIG